MNALVPCPSCQRHVRSGSGECPFCTATLDGIVVPKLPVLHGWQNRGALFFMGATLAALGANSCGSDSDGDKKGAAALDSGGLGGASDGGSGGSAGSVASGGSGGGPIDEGGVGDAYGTPDGAFGGAAGSAGAGGGPIDEGGFGDVYGTPFDGG